MKGSDECSACAYVPESMLSMDECYGSGRSCEMDGCFNTPQEDETICGSCWNKHDSSRTPGFPEGFDDTTEEAEAWLARGENAYADHASGDGESYDFRAEDFLDEVVPDQKCDCGLGFSTGDDLCPRC
jgi:hypothetical protein